MTRLNESKKENARVNRLYRKRTFPIVIEDQIPSFICYGCDKVFQSFEDEENLKLGDHIYCDSCYDEIIEIKKDQERYENMTDNQRIKYDNDRCPEIRW